MGGTPPSLAIEHYIKDVDLITFAQEALIKLQAATETADESKPYDITSWLDLARTSRQPQVLWEIDYIKPKPSLKEINNLIRQSELLLYHDYFSLDLDSKFVAEVCQEAAFHTIRFHLRAEEGEIDKAVEMMSSLIENWEEKLTVLRRSNLLFHGCLVYLCCGMFEKSFACFDRHWAITKYASPDERVSLGLWDNQVILQMVYWFFVKYVASFRDFYSVKYDTNTASSQGVWNHKKIALMYFLEYDPAWAVSFCGLPFYNRARERLGGLPKFEKKRSTPTNITKTWEPPYEVGYATDVSGPEQMYCEQFNREQSGLTRYPDLDRSDDHLYSYYHYQNDYAIDLSNKMALTDFLLQFVAHSDFDSVIDAGCGITVAPGLRWKKHIGVDISEKVCEILQEDGANYAHEPITRFLDKIDAFDLCFACDLLAHLALHRIRLFLKLCSQKCKCLAASIDTQDDIRTDIIQKLSITEINVHRTVMPASEWLTLLSEFYKTVESENRGNWIYVFCTNS